MMPPMTRTSPRQALRLACASLILLLAGCGMKGPLRHPAPPPPPPANAELVAPPTVAPTTPADGSQTNGTPADATRHP